MRTTITIAAISLCVMLFSYSPAINNNKIIENYYMMRLDSLSQSLKYLGEVITQNNNKDEQDAFKAARIAYKKIAILTDYLNPYETILLNSPALQRTEDDNPTIIIEPHGFQQLESLIWEIDTSFRGKSNKLIEINYLKDVLLQLENEPDRINKFNNIMVWDAMRISLITLVTKTLAGFDSPVAQYSIAEAEASLRGLESIIDIYQSSLEQTAPGYYEKIKSNIKDGYLFMAKSVDFNRFDRMDFIKKITNPLSTNLSKAALLLGYINMNERRPLNPAALNLFEKDAFDVNFFSPNQRYQFTRQRMLLGKKLFNDQNLSGNGLRSCASCHKPELAFTDGLPKALSLDNVTPLKRNTPTLLNAVFQTKQFYDSRETMLEFQISSVVHNEKEMGGSIEKLATSIKGQKDFAALFATAYPDEKDPVNVYTIANAIASYLRSLQTMNSKFDQYMRNENVAFSTSEKNGFNLFMGKAKCATCHFIPLFNGLVPALFTETESEIIGVPASSQKHSILDSDSGKYYFTKSPVHLHAFKTPTLRNIVLTAPYMHNGIYNTLEQVIDFYNKGGGKGLGISPPNQSLPFDNLKLSKSEKKDIINFLFTLTDTTSYKTFAD